MAEATGSSRVTAPTQKAVKPATAPLQDAIDNDEKIADAVDAEMENSGSSKFGSAAKKAREAVKGEASALASQASDKARNAANIGKGKVVEAAGSVTSVIGEAANSIDEQFGKEYGDYARAAQTKVDDVVGKINSMDIDEIIENTRQFVRKQPAIALGVAAAAGFAFIRVLKSGIDDAQ